MRAPLPADFLRLLGAHEPEQSAELWAGKRKPRERPEEKALQPG